jgi:hypothetical protein
MDGNDARQRLENALQHLTRHDRHLLENDLSERCIASRLAMHLQAAFPDHSVDVEYNRQGDIPKRLGLPDEYANFRDEDGRALVVPDVIVHQRGSDGPNVLVLEVKKTTNPQSRVCDHQRILAFRAQLGYSFGALIECETRDGLEPGAFVSEWHP